jgi:hypothetical protein
VTVREASFIEISNCKEVTVVCPKAIEIAIERSVGIHVITGPTVDLTTSCVSRLQVETQTEGSEKDLVCTSRNACLTHVGRSERPHRNKDKGGKGWQNHHYSC